MKKTFVLFILLIKGVLALAQPVSFYDFTVKDIKGNLCDFSQFKGYKVLVVNVASKCGLTPQYTQLQELYETYKDRDFVIIGFPCNDFKEQDLVQRKK